MKKNLTKLIVASTTVGIITIGSLSLFKFTKSEFKLVKETYVIPYYATFVEKLKDGYIKVQGYDSHPEEGFWVEDINNINIDCTHNDKHNHYKIIKTRIVPKIKIDLEKR